MCGIAGFTIAPGDYGQINTASMTILLGYEMQSRGKDATGIYTVDPKGRWKLRKRNIPADVFLAGRSGIGVSASSLLLHTRAATQGKATNPGNNHPIQYGNIVGIHNGIIWNDDALYDHYKWDRLAEVDSEAIFAAIKHLPLDDALTNIDGGWAIAWSDTASDARRLWLARGQISPLYYATTEHGSVIFASTHSAVKEAFKFGGITGDPVIVNAPEGFLAHTNPEGGLTILDKFDGSGEFAIGARKKTTYTSTTPAQAYASQGYMHGGSWPKKDSNPAPFNRITITGLAASPKVGDRRKYINNQHEWIYEMCTSVSPACWAEIHESKVGQAHPGESREFTVTPRGLVRELAVVPPFDQRKLSESERDADDFLAAEDANVRYGYAHEGDLICIPKKTYSADGRNDGGIIGIVTEIEDDQLTVEWRRGHLNIWDEYEILIAAQKGG